MATHSVLVPPVEKVDGVVAVNAPAVPMVKPDRLLELPFAV